MSADKITELLRAAEGWYKSSGSEGNSACVEITHAMAGWVGIRDSKLGSDSPILAIPVDRFVVFLASPRTNHE